MVMADGTAKEEEPATVSLLSLDCTRHTLSRIEPESIEQIDGALFYFPFRVDWLKKAALFLPPSQSSGPICSKGQYFLPPSFHGKLYYNLNGMNVVNAPIYNACRKEKWIR